MSTQTSEDLRLRAEELREEWTQLTQEDGPEKWLKKNQLIIEGGENSPEPKAVKCYLTGERVPPSSGGAPVEHKIFRLGPNKLADDDHMIEVLVHRFAAIDAPAARYSAASNVKFHLTGLALTDKPEKNAFVVTGQLSGGMLAVGGDKKHTVVTHVRANNGYGGLAAVPGPVALQDNAQKHGELEDQHGKKTLVTKTFGRNNMFFSGNATVVGQFVRGGWKFYGQRFDLKPNSAEPNYVVEFAANSPVQEVIIWK